jgi:hypothetical protein
MWSSTCETPSKQVRVLLIRRQGRKQVGQNRRAAAVGSAGAQRRHSRAVLVVVKVTEHHDVRQSKWLPITKTAEPRNENSPASGLRLV